MVIRVLDRTVLRSTTAPTGKQLSEARKKVNVYKSCQLPLYLRIEFVGYSLS
jgi:hypothetical protein